MRGRREGKEESRGKLGKIRSAEGTVEEKREMVGYETEGNLEEFEIKEE